MKFGIIFASEQCFCKQTKKIWKDVVMNNVYLLNESIKNKKENLKEFAIIQNVLVHYTEQF